MKTKTVVTHFSACFLFVILLTSCNNNPAKEAAPPKKPVVKKPAATHQAKEDEATALATITAPDYEIKIYGAFAFSPEGSEQNLLKPDSGNQFVVLDMSVLNTSDNKTVDIGKILVSAKVTDEKGTIYPRSALAVEAFELEYPEEEHKAEYRAMKGRLRPGQYYRTTAYGIEAPDTVKNFVIELAEGPAAPKNNKLLQAKFTIE